MSTEQIADPGQLPEKLGISYEQLSVNRVVATMPVAGNTQPAGFLHGGATCSLIETLASIGAGLVAGWPERQVMGQQQTTSFLATATSGFVRGIATPIHTGRSTHLWNVDVFDGDTGRIIATGRVTIAVRDPRKS